MAKILLHGGETIEEGCKRFEAKVSHGGILACVKDHSYFRSPSQKKRDKSKKAQKRDRKLQAKLRRNEKPLAKSYEFHDIDIRAGWPTSEEAKFEFLNPGPSAHVCVIATYNDEKGERIIYIKDDKDKFGFPGGGLKRKERPEDGAVREYREETGMIIRRPTNSDVVYDVTFNLHRFICYASEVVGGEFAYGNDIQQINLLKAEDVRVLANLGQFLPNHKISYFRYFQMRERQLCTT